MDARGEMRRGLEGLNQSLWLSELASEVDLVVPLDRPTFGDKALLEGSRYEDSKMFHKSALYSLAVDSLAHQMYSGSMELREVVPSVLYSQHPNLATMQMQLPYAFADNNDAHLIRDLQPETIQKAENYISFNALLRETPRPSMRHTFTLRGLDTLVSPH